VVFESEPVADQKPKDTIEQALGCGGLPEASTSTY